MRKNKKFIDPRYFMNEKTDVLNEIAVTPKPPSTSPTPSRGQGSMTDDCGRPLKGHPKFDEYIFGSGAEGYVYALPQSIAFGLSGKSKLSPDETERILSGAVEQGKITQAAKDYGCWKQKGSDQCAGCQ